MVADSDAAHRRVNWTTYRRLPGWLGLLANTALILAAGALGAAILYFARVISSANVAAAAIMIVSFAAVFGVAAGAARSRWRQAVLTRRVDILSQALDALPDPQLILAPDGRIAYANTAFHDLFSNADAPALDRIAAALADPDTLPDFERLRTRGEAGMRAIAALPLRDSRGAAAGWFNIAVNPIAGRPGYTFWDIHDITATPRNGGRDPRRAQQARRVSRRRADRLLFGGWRRPVSVRQSDARQMAGLHPGRDRRQRCAAA